MVVPVQPWLLEARRELLRLDKESRQRQKRRAGEFTSLQIRARCRAVFLQLLPTLCLPFWDTSSSQKVDRNT